MVAFSWFCGFRPRVPGFSPGVTSASKMFHVFSAQGQADPQAPVGVSSNGGPPAISPTDAAFLRRSALRGIKRSMFAWSQLVPSSLNVPAVPTELDYYDGEESDSSDDEEQERVSPSGALADAPRGKRMRRTSNGLTESEWQVRHLVRAARREKRRNNARSGQLAVAVEVRGWRKNALLCMHQFVIAEVCVCWRTEFGVPHGLESTELGPKRRCHTSRTGAHSSCGCFSSVVGLARLQGLDAPAGDLYSAAEQHRPKCVPRPPARIRVVDVDAERAKLEASPCCQRISMLHVRGEVFAGTCSCVHMFPLGDSLCVRIVHSRQDVMTAIAPQLILHVQQAGDAQLREDCIFILGEWAWMFDVEIPTQNPQDGSSSMQELSFLLMPILLQVVQTQEVSTVRLAAARALGSFAAVAASRYGYVMSIKQVQTATTSIETFAVNVRMQIVGICSVLSKCLQMETNPTVQCEILFTILRISHYITAMDIDTPGLLTVLQHVAKYSTSQRAQVLALSILRRIRSFASLQCATDILLYRRWTPQAAQ